MEESDVDNNGVFMLITELCRTITGSAQERVDATDVSKYRKEAYEILLYSNLNKATIGRDVVNNELLYQKFLAAISAHNNDCMEDRYESLTLCEKLVEKAKEHFSETNGYGDGINVGLGMLYTMLKVSEIEPNKKDNKIVDEEYDDDDVCQLLAPSPFNLYCNFEEAEKYYPDLGNLDKILHPKPKFFKGVESPDSGFFEYKAEELLFGFPTLHDTDSWLKGLHTKHACTDIFSMRFLSDNIEAENVSDTANADVYALQATATQQVTEATMKEDINQKTAQLRDSELLAWESYRCEGAPNICSFVSDKNFTFVLKEHNDMCYGRVFEPRIMPLEDFIKDLKWLAIGINTETFECDTNGVFTMVKNVTVQGLLPETLQKYAEPFLECGTRFKQLETMTNRTSTRDCTEGFAYRGICKAIAEYLKVFKLFVLAQNTNLLIQFYIEMEKIMQQLMALSKVINNCTPNEYNSEYVKGGAHLINYIWQEIKNCSKDDFISLLIFMLKSMCESYYRHLQQWIYHGILHDPHNELFICYVDYYPEKTKCHFENAYFVKVEAVPGFLSGCEQAILNCGKYTKLLHSFKANHPLFDIACPEFQLCLDDGDLEQVTRACELYYEKASAFCQPIDMNTILAQRAAAKQSRKVNIKKHIKELNKAWEEERLKMRQTVLEKKALQHKDLRMQQQEDLQLKLDARHDIIVNEQLVQAQLAKLEDEVLHNDNINVRARLNYLRSRKEWLQHDIQQATEQIERTLPWQRAERKAFIARETALIVEKLDETAVAEIDNLNLNVNTKRPTFNRTVSDIINSNVPTTETTELARVQLNTVSSTTNQPQPQQTKTALSEAQRNKLHGMTEEYMISMPTITTTTTINSDINLNTLPPESSEELSDLQRNRQHMMQTDLFCQYNRADDAHAQRIRERLTGDTELARNRRRVLNSEYNIISPMISETQNINSATTEDDFTLRKTPVNIIDIEETELERNRRRVLLSEYNIISHNDEEQEKTTTTTMTSTKTNKEKLIDEDRNSLENCFSSGILDDSTPKKCPSSDVTLVPELQHLAEAAQLKNSNLRVNQLETETELERNRRRVLGSEYNIIIPRAAPAQIETKETQSNINLAAENQADSKVSLMEEKSSSGIIADFASEASTTIVRIHAREAETEAAQTQQASTIPLTELERNRQRVLGSEYYISINQNKQSNEGTTTTTAAAAAAEGTKVIDKKSTMPKVAAIADTDLSRNRRQVMDSKYDILTGMDCSSRTRIKPANLQLIPVIVGDSDAAAAAASAATPMSTTSDKSLATIYEECNNEILDERNNNKNNEDDSMPKDNAESEEAALVEEDTNSSSSSEEYEEAVEEVGNHNVINCKEDCLETKPPIIEFNINATDFCSSSSICSSSLEIQLEWHEIATLLHTKSNALELLSKVSLLFQEQFNDVDDNDAGTDTDTLLPYRKVCSMVQQNFQLSKKSAWLHFGNALLKAADADADAENESNKFEKFQSKEICNIAIKQILQRCIMLPLQTHFSLVRNEVMRIFLVDLNIYEQFHSLRNYFFLMDGEFCELIVAGIIGQLDDGVSPQKLLNYHTLHGLLNKAINKSTTGATKYSEKLSFIVNQIPESFKHTSPDVLNMLTLSYNVVWPLNIVLNTETLERYSTIFQYLFKVRRISYLYERAFCCLNDKSLPKKLFVSMQYRQLTFIRHKFMHFVTTLQNYLTTAVLLSSWNKFKDALRAVDSVETLYQTHVQYLKKVTFLCLLNRKSFALRESIDNILKIVLRFYKVLTSEEFQLDAKTNEYTHSRYQRLIYEDTEFEKFRKYTIYLGNKVVRRGYQEEIRQFIDVISFDDHFK